MAYVRDGYNICGAQHACDERCRNARGPLALLVATGRALAVREGRPQGWRVTVRTRRVATVCSRNWITILVWDTWIGLETNSEACTVLARPFLSAPPPHALPDPVKLPGQQNRRCQGEGKLEGCREIFQRR